MKITKRDEWRYRRTPCVKQREEETGWNALIAAIIKQAIDDYKDADRMEKGIVKYSNTGITNFDTTKMEVVAFFKGKWYVELCDINPHLILRKLGAE